MPREKKETELNKWVSGYSSFIFSIKEGDFIYSICVLAHSLQEATLKAQDHCKFPEIGITLLARSLKTIV